MKSYTDEWIDSLHLSSTHEEVHETSMTHGGVDLTEPLLGSCLGPKTRTISIRQVGISLGWKPW
jgi:hypothetical protein